MSGRKRYDEDAALDAAMRVFWADGYEAASMSALERATGLNKSSLYNAYRSKEGLFEACLKRFSMVHGGPLAAALAEDDFAAALRLFFDRLIARFEAEETPSGCLATMAAMEAGGPGTRCGAIVADNQEAMRSAFAARARRAVADGQLAADMDCDGLAAALLSQTRGLAVLNRGAGDAALARAAVDGLLSVIKAASPPLVR